MQALWSRVGQTQHCGCTACVQAVHGVMRKSTTGAARRKATIGQVFTVCTTSILGTAAMLDAMRKEKRRKRVVENIEDAKARLEATRARNDSAVQHIAERAIEAHVEREFSQWTSQGASLVEQQSDIRRILETQTMVNRENLWLVGAQNRERQQRVRLLHSDVAQSPGELARQQALKKSARDRLYDAREAAILLQEQSSLPTRQPQTYEHLRMAKVEVLGLVNQLLTMIGCGGVHEPDSPTIREVCKLLSQMDSYAGYSLRLGDEHNDLLKDLHTALRANFARASKIERSELVARVCYNLLVSRLPLTANTYNILLNGFNRAGLGNLANAVASSFFHRTRVEPNSQTVVCLLDHYIETRNAHGLSYLLARLSGHSKYGIKQRRKDAKVVRGSAFLRNWAVSSGAVKCGRYFVQCPMLLGDTLDSIIRALAEFAFLEEAARVLVHCIQYSVNISTRTIDDLLTRCYELVDVRAASVLSRGLAVHFESFKTLCKEYDGSRLAAQISRIRGICRGTDNCDDLDNREIDAFLMSAASVVDEASCKPEQSSEVREREDLMTWVMDMRQLRLEGYAALAAARKVFVQSSEWVMGYLQQPAPKRYGKYFSLYTSERERERFSSIATMLSQRREEEAAESLAELRKRLRIDRRAQREAALAQGLNRLLVTLTSAYPLDQEQRGWTAEMMVSTADMSLGLAVVDDTASDTTSDAMLDLASNTVGGQRDVAALSTSMSGAERLPALGEWERAPQAQKMRSGVVQARGPRLPLPEYSMSSAPAVSWGAG